MNNDRCVCGRPEQHCDEGACVKIKDRAKIVARILSEHGFYVSTPDEGTLGDVERWRWNACVKIAQAIALHGRP
jgi:hypothetical protein